MTDTEIVKLIDDELSGEDRERIEEHLSACVSCRESLAVMKAAGERFASILDAAPVPAPRRTVAPTRPVRSIWSSRVLRAAVLILSLGTIAMLVSPVRAWILERVLDIRGMATPATTTAGTESAISFRVAGASLEIDFSVRPAGGQLRVVWTDSALARAAVDSPGGEDLLILGERLVIRNRSESRADYEISVPVGVDSLFISVADAEPLFLTRDYPAPATLNLAEFGRD